VIFREDSVLLKVKISKSKTLQGEYVDIFKVNLRGCCPVENLKNLAKISKNILGKPVFQFEDGTNLTAKKLTCCMRNHIKNYLGDVASEYSGHSLRAGIPSALANRPDVVASTEIKQWGRWHSEACWDYTRLKLEQKKLLFGKILQILKIPVYKH
jgi:hypothetical protein